MSDRHLLTDSLPKQAFAYGFLLLTGGPLPAWIGLRLTRPVADPQQSRSVPMLIVADVVPDDASEQFAR